MKTRTLLFATLALTALSGCHHVSHVGLSTKSFAISAGTKSSGGRSPSRAGPPHCPPGHAKKGEC